MQGSDTIHCTCNNAIECIWCETIKTLILTLAPTWVQQIGTRLQWERPTWSKLELSKLINVLTRMRINDNWLRCQMMVARIVNKQRQLKRKSNWLWCQIMAVRILEKQRQTKRNWWRQWNWLGKERQIPNWGGGVEEVGQGKDSGAEQGVRAPVTPVRLTLPPYQPDHHHNDDDDADGHDDDDDIEDNTTAMLMITKRMTMTLTMARMRTRIMIMMVMLMMITCFLGRGEKQGADAGMKPLDDPHSPWPSSSSSLSSSWSSSWSSSSSSPSSSP